LNPQKFKYLVIFTILARISFGQNGTDSIFVKEGVVDYEVNMIFNQDSYLEGQVFKKDFRVIFSPYYYRAEQRGGYLKNFTIVNRRKHKKRNFADFYGHHFELRDSVKAVKDYKFTYTGETQIIAGYKCDRVLVERAEGVYEAWITNQIGLNYPSYFPGFAMEYTVPTSRGVRVYRATRVSNANVGDTYFNVSDYKLISQDEMISVMKQAER
jgi:GLPGLI family protein